VTVRARLYGSLVALTAFVALVVVLGEARDGALTGGDVALAVAGVAAMMAIAILAVVALAYEIRAWLQRRKTRA
jgi:hypothetical protein